MPGLKRSGGAMGPHERASIVHDVVSGAQSVREVCERHELSPERLVDWVTEYRRSSLDAFDARLRQALESQGIAAPLDIAAPHFVVSRGELALPDLIQIMSLGRRSGVISVVHDGLESRLWCTDGEVIDAESGKLQGLAAVYRVLAVEQGRISTSFTAEVDRPRRVQRATMELLLEGARRADECNVARRALGAGYYRLAAGLPAHDPELSASERAVLNVFVSPSTIAEALAESDLGDLETLSLLQGWVARGRLAPDAGASRPRPSLLPEPVRSTEGPQVLTLASRVAPRPRPSSLARTALFGAVSGLLVGVGLWTMLVPQEAELTHATARAAAARARSTVTKASPAAPPVAPALASVTSAEAPLAAGEAASDVPTIEPAPPSDVPTIEPAPAPSEGPAASDAPAPEPEPAPSEAAEPPPPPPLSPSRESSAAPAALRASPQPLRPSLPRGPRPVAGALSAAAPALAERDAPEAGEPRQRPRMRIIEERVPRMRVLE